MGGMDTFATAVESLCTSFKKMNPFCIPFAIQNMGEGVCCGCCAVSCCAALCLAVLCMACCQLLACNMACHAMPCAALPCLPYIHGSPGSRLVPRNSASGCIAFALSRFPNCMWRHAGHGLGLHGTQLFLSTN